MSDSARSRLLTLAANMMSAYADRLGNDTCEDWKWPADWSIDDRIAFIDIFHEANGACDSELWAIEEDKERVREGSEYGIQSSCAALALAHVLRTEATK